MFSETLNQIPDAPAWYPINSALKDGAEIQKAIIEAKRLRLPLHDDQPKTWDSLGALHQILTRTNPESQILDAGAEWYSTLLPWLSLYGYRNLVGNNLTFDKQNPKHVGPIRYEYGDITSMEFEDSSFDAIACLSVVEHGVEWRSYFQEMARVLKPGGVLTTSVDYFESPTDSRGQVAFGVPIRVYTREDMLGAFAIARSFGLEPTGEVDLECRDRAITWKEFGLSYTFLVFSLSMGG